ncbi:MAG: hypothetical protein ACRD27_04465 [Terracidiphilus sp.]
MPSFDIQTVQIIVLALVAVAVVLQVILVIAIFAGMGKMGKTVKEEVEDMRSSVMPIVYNTRELLANVTPKIESTVEDLAALIHGLRTQSKEVETVGTEVLERLRRQSSRLDTMMSGLLDSVDRTGAAVADAVNRPVRQVSGLLASAKAVVESLRDSTSASAPRPPHTPPTPRTRGDRDMFV